MYGGIYGSVTSRCLDKFSVFIGNLHESITDAELKQEFDPFGDILNIHVIRKPYHYHHKRVFAFIKYQHEGEAAKAIDHEVIIIIFIVSSCIINFLYI
jgi:RNA recognition motif-containing protein